jgi:hypothetical protein
MSRIKTFEDTLAIYQKHGWRLARILTTAESLEELKKSGGLFDGIDVQEFPVDAMWLTRSAHGGREAWELRQVGEPFALFELFEPGEDEEDREDVRREMEARLREHAAPSKEL